MIKSSLTLRTWLACMALTFSLPAYGQQIIGNQTHYYGTGFQYVDNRGGSSWLNIWKPDPSPGVMSLSQQWYTSGAPTADEQTVEGGWVVEPRKWGGNPVLFVYWTVDHYATTGCYNLECPGFVQVDNSIVLGVTPLRPSTDGGSQYSIKMTWVLDDKGNWWVSVNDTWIGYYPGAIFKGGQMSKNAKYLMYGGETASLEGAESAGQMGSGKYANAGFGHAAFQGTIYYIDTALTSHWTALQAHEPNPQCYTSDVILGLNDRVNPGTYVFFGGPICPLWGP